MMRFAGDTADGLLGADILLAFDIDLDLPTAASRSTAPAATAPRPGRRGPSPISASPASPRDRDRLLVPFELDGVAGLGVLDTGAQLSSISMRMAERVGLAEGELAGDGTVMAHGAAPDQVAVRIHRFRELRIGSTVMHEPTLPVVPMSDGMGDALVGADFLQGRRVWLSFATSRVFVTPIDRGPAIAEAR